MKKKSLRNKLMLALIPTVMFVASSGVAHAPEMGGLREYSGSTFDEVMNQIMLELEEEFS